MIKQMIKNLRVNFTLMLLHARLLLTAPFRMKNEIKLGDQGQQQFMFIVTA